MLKVSILVYKMYLWYALVFQAKRIRNLFVLLSHLNFCTDCHESKLYKPGPTMQVLRGLWFVFKYLLVLVNKYTIVLSKVTLIVLSFILLFNQNTPKSVFIQFIKAFIISFPRMWTRIRIPGWLLCCRDDRP